MALPVYVRGVSTQVILSEESSYGVQASGPGQLLRRAEFEMNPQPPSIPSSEITQDSQTLAMDNGVNSVPAMLRGELSPGTYKSFFEGVSRGTFTTGVSASGISDSSLAINGTTGIITLTSASSNFLTLGFKKGDVVRPTGLTSGPAVMNSVNLRTVNVTATTLVFGPNKTAVAWASGQGALSLAVAGKKVFVPRASTQVFRSYSMERFDSTISRSRLGLGLRVSQVGITTQPNNAVSFQVSMIGRDHVDASSQVYASPTSQSTSNRVSAAAGLISYAGADIGYCTSFSLQLSQAPEPVPVVGASVVADIILGNISASGSMSVLVNDQMTFDTDFFLQNDVEVAFYLPASPLPEADFISVYLPRIRLQAPSRQDSDRAIRSTFSFNTLQKTAGGTGTAYDNTSFVVQDSLA